jgi:hypothetical protein
VRGNTPSTPIGLTRHDYAYAPDGGISQGKAQKRVCDSGHPALVPVGLRCAGQGNRPQLVRYVNPQNQTLLMACWLFSSVHGSRLSDCVAERSMAFKPPIAPTHSRE